MSDQPIVANNKEQEKLLNNPNNKDIKSSSSNSNSAQKPPVYDIILLLLIILLTIFFFPTDWKEEKVSIFHVFYNGWLTAVATGLGVLPFFFLSEPSAYLISITNAMAAGMMLSATFSLIQEGSNFEVVNNFGILSLIKRINLLEFHSIFRTFVGFCIGFVFIFIIEKILNYFEEDEKQEEGQEKQEVVTTSSGSSRARTILIILVMTLHSMSEGIGIGVSFGGNNGHKLGHFISFSLAFHNIPEGLTVGLVMLKKNYTIFRIILWAIFTSIPQPIFAVPSYLFIEKFAPLLPGGKLLFFFFFLIFLNLFSIT